MVLGIVIGAITATLIFGSMLFFRRLSVSSGGRESETYKKQIEDATRQVRELLASANNFVSRGQVDALSRQIQLLKTDLATEGRLLKEIEQKLETAQSNVEEREAGQQNVKTSRQEDEARLQELLTSYADIYAESISLEQSLAASLKSLDAIISELKLTDVQKEIFVELNNILTEAGARVRDLMMEYETTKQRLEMLRTQHTDLENEYAKLVEQQLGD